MAQSTISYVLIVGPIHTQSSIPGHRTLGLFAHHVINVPMDAERASAWLLMVDIGRDGMCCDVTVLFRVCN